MLARHGLAAATAVLLVVAAPLRAGEPRGPFALRDAHLLAQPRLTLPPGSPFTLGRGRASLRLGLLWGNSFAWAQDVPGEQPRARRYLIDGEALALDLAYTRGLSDRVDVGLRVPLQWRGGGVMDGFLDAFHRAFRFAGVGDGERPAFRRDAFRVEGRTSEGRAFAWNDATGVGLGDVEASLRVCTTGNGQGSHGGTETRRTAGCRGLGLVVRVSLPTGTGGFAGQGVALGAQVLAAHPLGAHADAFAGLGATLGGSRRVRGVGYERVRGQAFAVFERRLGARASLVLGSEIATRLVRDVDGFPGVHWTAHAGVWRDVGARSRLAFALVENIAAQAATADLTLHVAWELRR
jgi:hypothetical protein